MPEAHVQPAQDSIGKLLRLPVSRRHLLAGLGLAALGAACGGGGGAAGPTKAPPGSLQALLEGASQLAILGTGPDAPPMNPGPNRVALVLLDIQSRAIEGARAEFWLATDMQSRAAGPFPATWRPFTAYAKTGDRSPESPLPGAYAADVSIPTADFWNIGVSVEAGSRPYAGTGILQAKDGPVPVQLGSKAISVPTPVATSDDRIAEICTRTPVDHLHYISLDEALANGRPTVMSFGTPLLCTSRLCGPVLDEQILAFEEVRPDRANFIHVEEFLPGPDLRPPPATLENISPAFKAWGLDTDPWVVIADRDGVIRFRSLGPVTAPEIEQALQPWL